MIKNEKFWFFKKVKYEILNGKKGVKEAYDLIAKSYDHSKYLYWTRKMEKGEEKIINKWIKNISEICLDVGCGTGRYSIKIAKKECEILALDISLEMLKKLKEKINGSKLENNINLILADAENLPFREKVFKSLICTLTINHFENLEKAIEDFSRVLKKDSICIISTFNSYTLKGFQKRHKLLEDKVPFKTEDTPPILVYEIGYSAKDIKKILLKYGFKIEYIKGCCYWHIFPSILTGFYPFLLDKLFNLFKGLLKYAEIHILLMKKSDVVHN